MTKSDAKTTSPEAGGTLQEHKLSSTGCTDEKCGIPGPKMHSDDEDSPFDEKIPADMKPAMTSKARRKDSERSVMTSVASRRKPPYKKKTPPPEHPKLAFVLFSAEKGAEILQSLGESQQSSFKPPEISSVIAKAWQSLSPQERAVWDEKAVKDNKARPPCENESSSGSITAATRSRKRKPKKDPDAPKRPMSAFLAFSNCRRAAVRRENPDLNNAETSKKLAEMWRNAPAEIKKQYVDEAARLQQVYKVAASEWRAKKAKKSIAEVENEEQGAIDLLEGPNESETKTESMHVPSPSELYQRSAHQRERNCSNFSRPSHPHDQRHSLFEIVSQMHSQRQPQIEMVPTLTDMLLGNPALMLSLAARVANLREAQMTALHSLGHLVATPSSTNTLNRYAVPPPPLTAIVPAYSALRATHVSRQTPFDSFIRVASPPSEPGSNGPFFGQGV